MFAIYSDMSDQWKTNLRQAMKANELTMNAVSKRLGKNPHYVTQMLTRAHAPSVKTLEPLAEILGTTVSDLIEADLASNTIVQDSKVAKTSPEVKNAGGSSQDLSESQFDNIERFRAAYREAQEILATAKQSKTSRISEISFAVLVATIYEEKTTLENSK
ncbi:helix-turn-helix domain-containing protein [Roseibium sp.]|uniref:helix-turn-helix transcriptional regulator n=1 Tax=Roseibium sp. TaxID=1936156 RepID=UPI003299DE24